MNSSIIDILTVLDEDFQLEEENSLDPTESPVAFSKRKPNDGGVYTVKPEPSEKYFKKIAEVIGSVDHLLSEINYKDYKTDDSRTESNKINSNIKEINRKLYEVERLIDHASRLKTESGADQRIFWKGTLGRFEKINERLNRLSTKIREMNS